MTRSGLSYASDRQAVSKLDQRRENKNVADDTSDEICSRFWCFTPFNRCAGLDVGARHEFFECRNGPRRTSHVDASRSHQSTRRHAGRTGWISTGDSPALGPQRYSREWSIAVPQAAEAEARVGNLFRRVRSRLSIRLRIVRWWVISRRRPTPRALRFARR